MMLSPTGGQTESKVSLVDGDTGWKKAMARALEFERPMGELRLYASLSPRSSGGMKGLESKQHPAARKIVSVLCSVKNRGCLLFDSRACCYLPKYINKKSRRHNASMLVSMFNSFSIP